MRKSFNKVKTALVLGSALAVTSASANGIAYNKSTGEFTGNVDLGAYFSGVEIAVAVVGVTLGISLFFRMLKQAKA